MRRVEREVLIRGFERGAENETFSEVGQTFGQVILKMCCT